MKVLSTVLIALSISCASPAYALDKPGSVNPLKTKSDIADRALTEGAETEYTIGPQNLIQIKIFGEAGASQIYRVDDRGYIKHSLVGAVKLGGMTVSEAEKQMETALAGDYILDPHVNVFVLEHSRFSVLGEVRKPGNYEILGRVSVVEAVSMAGGFTPVAAQGNVKIIRKGQDKEQTLNVDVGRITSGGNLKENIYVEADDVIVVGKSFF